jgi:hypothetical protein
LTPVRIGCLDPELPTIDHVVTMLLDEPHERGDGRSKSAAKKADAVFKIAFARRSSRFSRSNSTSRRRSSLDTPGLRYRREAVEAWLEQQVDQR